MFAPKLSRAAGARVILTSSSDEKLAKTKEQYPSAAILTVNYKKTPNWGEEVMRLTNGTGVDFVVENGGAPSWCKVSSTHVVAVSLVRSDIWESRILLISRSSFRPLSIGGSS